MKKDTKQKIKAIVEQFELKELKPMKMSSLQLTEEERESLIKKIESYLSKLSK